MPKKGLEMVVVGLVKYKYLRNYSAHCLNSGIIKTIIMIKTFINESAY